MRKRVWSAVKKVESFKDYLSVKLTLGLLAFGSAFGEDNPMLSGLDQADTFGKKTVGIIGQFLAVAFALTPLAIPLWMGITTIIEKRKRQSMGQEVGYGGALVSAIKDFWWFYAFYAFLLISATISLGMAGYGLADIFKLGWDIILQKR